MHQHSFAKCLLAAASATGLIACSVAELDDSQGGAASDDTELASRYIVGGSVIYQNERAVAVYPYGTNPDTGATGWFALCSGAYLGTVDGWAIVTTAAHCVSGSDGFGYWDPTWIRLSTLSFPGRPWDSPPARSPPPNLVTPAWVAGDWWANPDLDLDHAVILAPDNADFRAGLTSLPFGRLPGLAFMTDAELVGSTFSVDGYGLQGSPSTSGVLKRASDMHFSKQRYGNKELEFVAGSNGDVSWGDSGSGLVEYYAYPNANGEMRYWSIQVGTVRSISSAVAARFLAEMVQRFLGYLYLSPMSSPDSFLVLDGAPRLTTSPASASVRLFYNTSTKQLSDAAGQYCLASGAAGVPCDPSTIDQKWSHNVKLQLVSDANGLCLDRRGPYGHAQVAACSNIADQAWVFHVGSY
jgi:hypothetical protein